MNELHHIQIPADVLADAQELLERLKQLLKPYGITLTARDRTELPKMGNKNLSFVAKAYELAKLHPDLVPPYLKLDDFSKDFSDATNLLPLLVNCQEVTSIVSDTALVAGSEAYISALTFYQAAKTASKLRISGSKTVAQELRERFPRNTHRKSVATTAAEMLDD
jgi:hypothetical protein